LDNINIFNILNSWFHHLWFKLIVEVLGNENKGLTTRSRFLLEPLSFTDFRWRDTCLSAVEKVNPISWWQVYISFLFTFSNDWGHHKVATEHELVVNSLSLWVTFKFLKHGSNWRDSGIFVLLHKLPFVVFQMNVNLNKLLEEISGFFIIINLVHVLWLESNVRSHNHISKCT